MRNRRQPVVVGIDETAASVAALRWSAREAEKSRSPLLIVHAYELTPGPRAHREADTTSPGNIDVDDLDRAALEQYARALVAAANDVVAETAGRLSVLTRIIEGEPADVLVAEAGNASVLVLGSHDRGLLDRSPRGSVGGAVAANTPCPLVVVRGHDGGDPGARLPVVVGIDRVADQRTTLSYAVGHAARHGAPLHLAHIRRRVPSDPHESDRLDARLRDLAFAVEKEHPSLDVTWSVLDGHPLSTLIGLSGTADIVVIGTGHRQGGVVTGLLHHSRSPVALIPASTIEHRHHIANKCHAALVGTRYP